MNGWYVFQMIVMAVVLIVIVLIVCMIGWDKWREHRKKGSREVAAARARGRSLIETQYGWLTVLKYIPYTDTEYVVTLMDHNRVKYNIDINAHELKPVNIMQAAFGPGPAMFSYLPGDRAKRIVKQKYRQADETEEADNYKQEAERERTHRLIAEAKPQKMAEDIIDKAKGIEQSKQPREAPRR